MTDHKAPDLLAMLDARQDDIATSKPKRIEKTVPRQAMTDHKDAVALAKRMSQSGIHDTTLEQLIADSVKLADAVLSMDERIRRWQQEEAHWLKEGSRLRDGWQAAEAECERLKRRVADLELLTESMKVGPL